MLQRVWKQKEEFQQTFWTWKTIWNLLYIRKHKTKHHVFVDILGNRENGDVQTEKVEAVFKV